MCLPIFVKVKAIDGTASSRVREELITNTESSQNTLLPIT
jgi:hypothetical protein